MRRRRRVTLPHSLSVFLCLSLARVNLRLRLGLLLGVLSPTRDADLMSRERVFLPEGS